ncbi:MAG: NHL repeat-containing protein [Coriobacteriia bacterium]|nr:NHL repeat-containing protein [Coriobacteriia bacterium]
MSEARSRKSRVFLIAVLLLLVVLLCGLLWIYQSLSTSPERAVVEADVAGVEFEFGAYAYTNSEGVQTNMVTPVGVAYDGDNRIYATMPTEDTVVVFDADGSNGRVFVQDDSSVPRDTLSEFKVVRPLGIDVDDNGDVYIACEPKAAVVVFDEDGTKLREIPAMAPRYLCVKNGLVYVLSKGTLHIYDRQGTEVGRWGTFGRGLDQLSYPVGVTVTDDGTILIADTNNYRVVALSPDLEPVWIFGRAATTQEAQNRRILASPVGIALDSDGTAFVIDMLNCSIRVFDVNGNMIGEPLGEKGSLDNQFYNPSTLDHMEEDLFVIADQANNRLLGVRLNAVGDAVMTPGESVEGTTTIGE